MPVSWHMINLKCYLEKQLLFFSEAPIVNNIIILCERYAGTCSLYTHSLYHMGKITLSATKEPRNGSSQNKINYKRLEVPPQAFRVLMR